MRVIEVTERSSVDIPLSELLHGSGLIKIRPDLIGKGLVEIRQQRNTLTLRVNGLVGRLPITDDLALDVRPKFSVSNLNRIVYAANTELHNPFDFYRPYQSVDEIDYLPVPLIRSFSKSLARIILQGLVREYKHEIVHGNPRPKINFAKTAQRYWARMDHTKAVTEQFIYSSDVLVNQCLKLAATKANAIALTTPQLNKTVTSLAESLRQLERVSLKAPSFVGEKFSELRLQIPRNRSDYFQAISEAIEIIRNTDFSLDTSSKGLAFESYIINLDDVFERYVRSVMRLIKCDSGRIIQTMDGNDTRHQKPLFQDNPKYKMKPDLVVKESKEYILIGDVKYKAKASEEDRYQIIAHALSYGVNKALLIYPKSLNKYESGLVRVGEIKAGTAKLEVFEYYFDLSSSLIVEEEKLRNAIIQMA